MSIQRIGGITAVLYSVLIAVSVGLALFQLQSGDIRRILTEQRSTFYIIENLRLVAALSLVGIVLGINDRLPQEAPLRRWMLPLGLASATTAAAAALVILVNLHSVDAYLQANPLNDVLIAVHVGVFGLWAILIGIISSRYEELLPVVFAQLTLAFGVLGLMATFLIAFRLLWVIGSILWAIWLGLIMITTSENG